MIAAAAAAATSSSQAWRDTDETTQHARLRPPQLGHLVHALDLNMECRNVVVGEARRLGVNPYEVCGTWTASRGSQLDSQRTGKGPSGGDVMDARGESSPGVEGYPVLLV